MEYIIAILALIVGIGIGHGVTISPSGIFIFSMGECSNSTWIFVASSGSSNDVVYLGNIGALGVVYLYGAPSTNIST